MWETGNHDGVYSIYINETKRAELVQRSNRIGLHMHTLPAYRIITVHRYSTVHVPVL